MTGAIALKPDAADAYNNRGHDKFKLGDYRGAVADYSRTIELNSDNVFTYSNRGAAKSRLGDYRGAIATTAGPLSLSLIMRTHLLLPGAIQV